MQQTAGFYIKNIPAEQFDAVIAEINRYFDEIENKPEYFDEWRMGLIPFKNQGAVRLLSDVRADYFEYEIILPGLMEHVAENIPGLVMEGNYNLYNDDTGDEYHEFAVKENGCVAWEGEEANFGEDMDDELLFAAADMAYGEPTTTALYNGVFSLLTASDRKKAFDICAAILYEGAPIEAVYVELGVEDEQPTLADLTDLIAQCNDSIGCPSVYTYINYLIDAFAQEDIDIAFPEELQDAINALM